MGQPDPGSATPVPTAVRTPELKPRWRTLTAVTEPRFTNLTEPRFINPAFGLCTGANLARITLGMHP